MELRLVLRVFAVLTILRGLAPGVMAAADPAAEAENALYFAQYGLAFVLIAVLNLVVWLASTRTAPARYAVHACNLLFLFLCLWLSAVNVDVSLYLSAVLVGGLTAIGFAFERAVLRSRAR